MMKMLQKSLFVSLLLSCSALWAQTVTNPTPQTIPYIQNFNTLAANATTYPAGWQGWSTATTLPSGVTSFSTSAPLEDKNLTASSHAGTTSGNIHNYDGKIGFLTTGSVDLALALSVNTTGLQNILCQYDISTIRNPYGGSNSRFNEVVLQYRVGTSGVFKNIDDAPIYQNNTVTQTTSNVTTPQNTITQFVVLPEECNNKSIVQLRWVSRQVSGSGGRPSFALDNIEVRVDNSPKFIVNPTSLNFGGQEINTVSSEKSFDLDYSNLSTANTLVATSAPFSISKTSGGPYSQSLTYTSADLNGSSTTIYVKYSPTTAAINNETIAITGGGTTITTNVALTGTGLDPNFEINTDYAQNFDDANYLVNSYWKQVSVKGSAKTWEYTSSNPRTGAGAAYMNGFSETETDGDGNKPSDDWLISPKMNLTSFTNYPIVSFWSRKWFAGPTIKVYVSTTYNGSGTINLADWTEITSPGLPNTTGVWLQSNNLDLSAYKTAATYIAFRYATETGSNGNAAEWRIDDFSLTNKTATSSIPKNTITFTETSLGSTSTSKSFNFTSSGYGDITINAPSDFEISADNANFHPSLTVLAADAVSAKTIYARFKPSTTTAQISGELTFSGTGLTENGPTLLGSSLLKSNTFDLATWNMEFFGNGTAIAGSFGPTDRNLQINNAAIVYNNMLPDVIGIQEISDETAVDELLAKLPSTYKKRMSQVYSYSIKPPPSNDPFPAQKLGFIYNSATVDTVGFRAMFVGIYKDAVAGNTSPVDDSFWSSGRLPFIGTFNVTTLDGLKKKVNVVVIHAKSGGNPTDYNRRVVDVQVLRDSLAAQYPGENNAIIGDYNDFVVGSNAGNLTSPFKVFTDNGYKALTLDLLNSGKGTYVGSTNPSMIDNIIVSTELDAFTAVNSTAIEDARDYISGYATNTSDHLPVYSRFSFPIGTLPIDLADFDARANGNVTAIKWTTLTETNNDYFTVERSTDGKNFIGIKTVKGAGNSEQIRNYNTVDANPINGTNYYRLKQTDFNGKFSYSAVKAVKFANLNENALKIYPNPVINKATFSLATESASAQLVVNGIDGKPVLRETGSIDYLNQKLNSKIGQFAKGVYILKLTVDEQQYKAKFIKQ